MRQSEQNLPPRGRARDNPKDNKNYGSFLKDLAEETGSQVGPNRREFAASSSVEGARRQGDVVSGVGSRRPREAENDSASNIDALSIGSRGNPLNTGIGLPGFSPPKAAHASSVGLDNYTNRTNL